MLSSAWLFCALCSALSSSIFENQPVVLTSNLAQTVSFFELGHEGKQCGLETPEHLPYFFFFSWEVQFCMFVGCWFCRKDGRRSEQNG